MQIDTNLYKRQGAAITNITQTLPAPKSELAQQTFKESICYALYSPSMFREEAEKNYGADISTLARMIEAGEL